MARYCIVPDIGQGRLFLTGLQDKGKVDFVPDPAQAWTWNNLSAPSLLLGYLSRLGFEKRIPGCKLSVREV